MFARKKPVTIEAVPAYDLYLMLEDQRPEGLVISEEYARAVEESIDLRADLPFGSVVISTLEGDMIARATDMVIRGVKGELYPCRLDIFMETYEACTDDNS